MITTPVNIAILEDHPIVAEAISLRVQPFPVSFCHTIHSLNEIVTLPFKPSIIDLWIIDLELGKDSSWNLIENLCTVGSSVRVLVYTMYDSPWILWRLRRLGVDLIVSKSDPVEEFDRALKAYFSGESYISSTFRIADNGGHAVDITARERQVLSLLVEGLTTLEISQRLGVSDSTVCTYRKSLMEKFGVHKVAELINKSRGLT